MSPLSSTATAARTHEGALPDLIASLHASLQGAPDLVGCQNSTFISPAFTDGSLVRPLTAPDGVWAVLREAADGSRQVLCLHNPSADPVSVDIDVLLPESVGRQLHFVRGSMNTTQETDGLHAHLDAFGHVWVALGL
ncbi:hypothetical protein ACIBO9_40225 [Streptomyces prunicolor]|uniref:hypothetical protein n=1 Tax=Streptomyces prunicolor TaxID=67348 RepID=UPI0037D603C8